MAKLIELTRSLAGIGSNKTSHAEKLVSGLGGFFGILLILILTRQFLDPGSTVLIVASMGASAVLLFAVPHGPLSQPWALAGGHLVSAAIGVSCYLLIPNPFVAAACAVGLAITVMHYLRCIHPPGGATALTTVIAGPDVHALAYQYMLTPVLLNVLVILAVAIVFNFAFPWRRYPAALMHYAQRPKAQAKNESEATLSREELEHALQQMNMVIDISHDDLEKIYHLARNRVQSKLAAVQVRLGHYYSNGEYGNLWSVRQIIDQSEPDNGESALVIYKTVAGKDRRSTGTMSREAFADWAKYEVYLNENSWQRVLAEDSLVTNLA